ncbi:MAG TPA: sugar phosphate nucleotidyltransferase [Myxococcaceae bacterium]|nr:sugar phosphate nucleotidyltransferase [Myxococcaceae bacterium]
MTTMSCAALIMAGGRSERMRAGGSSQHKALRTVLGVPLIEHCIASLLRFGFNDLFVAMNGRERALADWLHQRRRDLFESDAAKLEVLIEDQPLGTIGAVASLPEHVEDVVIVNVDNLTDLNLRQLALFHRESRAAATVATHQERFQIPFGRLDLAGQSVVGYEEKPELAVWISSGAYVLGRSAIDRVSPGTRLDLPTLIHSLIGAGETVVGYRHQAAWIDINDENALVRAEELVRSAANGGIGAVHRGESKAG